MLSILDVVKSPPSYEFLCLVARSFLCRVPFENISKLYHRSLHGIRSRPTFENFLDGIVNFHFGGTCYTNNYYLNLLLIHLGFRVKLCGADMTRPDVHLVNVVTLGDREYLVDAGYAAPFFSPMPLDLTRNWAFTFGRDTYVLAPKDCEGHSRVEIFRDGSVRHGYRVNPRARRIDEFAEVVAHSYTDDATFMNAVLLVKFFDHRSIAINNLEIIESSETSFSVTRIPDSTLLPATIERIFDISHEISEIALARLTNFGDI